MSLKVGDKAPDFKLFNTEKQEISLSQYAGKTVVLHFFPAAFTGTCTAQLCTLRDDFSFYNHLDCVILGLSCDMIYSLIKFKADNNLDFDLISDYNREVCGLYGAQYDIWNMGIKGNSKRSAFIIDGNGTLQYVEVLDKAGDQVNFPAMKEVLSQLGK